MRKTLYRINRPWDHHVDGVPETNLESVHEIVSRYSDANRRVRIDDERIGSIAAHTGLSISYVTDMLQMLLFAGLIAEVGVLAPESWYTHDDLEGVKFG